MIVAGVKRRPVARAVLCAVVTAALSVPTLACSSDDGVVGGVQLPTTSTVAAAGHEPPSRVITATEALDAVQRARDSGDLCELVGALMMPLPTSAGGDAEASDEEGELYQNLAAMVGSSADLVPTDDADFPTLVRDWEAVGDALNVAATELTRLPGDLTNPVLVAALRSDQATSALRNLERFDRVRCGEAGPNTGA